MVRRNNKFLTNSILSKTAACLAIGLLMTGMTACTMPEAEEGTTVSVSKDGTVTCNIVEGFDKPYYDQEELKQMILSEVADYNREAEGANISVEKIEIENSLATVVMNYASAKDYADFHGKTFFLGTAKEAKEAGYDLNTVLSSTEDELETIGMSDMLAMTDYQILITDMKEPVTLNGKAAYVSDNTIYSNSLKTVTFGGESDELAYVMYR